MNLLTAAGVALLLALLVVMWMLRRRSRAAADDSDRLDTVAAWPPSATRVLTAAERQAYKTIVRALPDHMILAKVPLARFLKVPSRHSYSEWLRRLGSQCADLVVCDMASEVIAVVSVRAMASDRSERANKRHKRMARVMKAARIPLHEWPDNSLPTVERIREMLLPKAAEGGPAVRLSTAPTVSRPSPLGPSDGAMPQRERDEVVEPPPSTWFDEFNSGPTPLQPPKSSP